MGSPWQRGKTRGRRTSRAACAGVGATLSSLLASAFSGGPAFGTDNASVTVRPVSVLTKSCILRAFDRGGQLRDVRPRGLAGRRHA